MKLKYEVVNAISRRFGYTSYLEICTPLTGFTYSLVDREQLTRRMRLMYACPPDYADGEPIDLRTEAESGESLLSGLMQAGRRFDLVFIDPAHSYANSICDLTFGLQLIRPGGTVVVHDCNPGNSALAQPDFRAGNWCGLTYAAFLDLVLGSKRLSYITVNTDFGCGIMSKDRRWRRFSRSRMAPSLAARWHALELSERFPFFDQNRKSLLRLISTARFERCLAMPERSVWNWIGIRLRPRAFRAS